MLLHMFLIVDTCLSCEDTADKVVRWCPDGEFLAIFLHPVFSTSRVQHISDLHSKFVLRPHHVCGSMIDIPSATAEITRGRNRKKKPRDEIKMPASGQPERLQAVAERYKVDSREQHLPSMLAHCTQKNQELYRTTMGQERLDSLSLLCIEADILRSVDFEDVIKDFALAKSRKRTF